MICITHTMDNEQEEIKRLKGRQKSISTGIQTCWLGVVIAACGDAIFHFCFGETWFFIPMMFFLALFLPLLGCSYIVQERVKAKLKAIQDNTDLDIP